MKKIVLVIAALGVVGAVYYGMHEHNLKYVRSQKTSVHSAPLAPTLVLVDLNGNKIDTSRYAGNVVFVNFWAAWCTPCAGEIPQIMALQDKYRAQGLRVLGISMDDTDSALRDFYRRYKMNYPVVAGSEKIAEAYGGVLGLPTSILIGRDGHIYTKYVGMTDFAKVERDIVVLLSANR